MVEKNLGGNFPVVRHSLRPVSEGKCPSWNVKNESSKTYYTLQSGICITSSQEDFLYFLAITFPRNFRQTALNVSHNDFSASVSRCSDK
jgi:hypothetical protein